MGLSDEQSDAPIMPMQSMESLLFPMPKEPETVRIMCPNLACRKVLAVPSKARGKTVRCRNCSTNIKIPGLANPAGEKSGDGKTSGETKAA